MVSSHRAVGKADPACGRASGAALLPEKGRAVPDVNMPKLSDTMEEGTVVEWKKKSGDEVKAGEVLAEVESDKATFDLEAEDDGKLQILVEKGVPAKIGAPIARIGEAAAEPTPAKAESKAKAKAEPKPEPKAEEAAGKDAPEGPPPAEEAPPVQPEPAPPRAAEDGQRWRDLRASPLAKRLAEE